MTFEDIQLVITAEDETTNIEDAERVKIVGPREHLLMILEAGMWILGAQINYMQDGDGRVMYERGQDEPLTI